ncbi:MAG: MBOAT family protein [Oscillospiraceae bacterium]|jgi:D-alanyl-lipoteichoic acid acyltransferase DltB (MBOAT superfamily)|nr:MBOAT family protein [Oscillospiraceae bacterium]
MNFNSLSYCLYLPVTLILYFLLPKRVKNPFLLAASYFFYMCWEPQYALLMLTSTGATYLCARLMAVTFLGRRRLWLILSLALNLLILFFFKYYNFTADLTGRLFALLGVPFTPPLSGLLLPVGISFYTFQALGYTMDVYRGELPAERNFIDYALFVSYFPQLVAGPIERSRNLLPQLKEPHPFCLQALFEGFTLFLWGMFKKLVIADRLAIMVNFAFDAPPGTYGGLQYAVAAAAFSLQIYCDFSAYSDIARGSARMMGITLMRNFDAPFLAGSIKDFWRRWHISLSTWFKDYLYFPLGGSRSKTALRRYLNLMAVFLVSGLWHGAALTFFAWGLIHGLFQVASGLTKNLRAKALATLRISPANRGLHVFRVVFNFALVAGAFVFFRAKSVMGALSVLKRILLDPLGGSVLAMGVTGRSFAAVLCAVVLLFAVDAQARKGDLAERIAGRRWLKYAVYFALLVGIMLFGVYGEGYDPQEFIYFQF